MFEELYAGEARLGQFLEAMSGFQAANFHQLAGKFDFSRYGTVSDIGGALGLLSRIVGSHYEHLTFTTFDLPPVAPHAQKTRRRSGHDGSRHGGGLHALRGDSARGADVRGRGVQIGRLRPDGPRATTVRAGKGSFQARW